MFNMLNRSWYDSPWRRMRQLQREMNRLFGDFSSTMTGSFPAVNIRTHENGAIITAELPGVDPEKLDITASENSLTLRGERTRPEPEGLTAWHRTERRVGAFSRTIEMPFAIDRDKIEARFRNGVLEVHLSRVEAQKPRKISVQAG